VFWLGPVSDGGAAAVGGDDGAGDVAGLGRGRKAITLAISSGWAARFMMVVSPTPWVTSAGWMPVYTGPEATVLMRTPARLYSAAQDRVIESSAAFVAP
jgi:hypothetical protein